ncbi:MAG: type II secretion system F family protein [Planctomycetaceae bacterium]
MPQFHYTARKASGEPTTGTVWASSRREALESLARQSLLPVTVQQQSQRRLGKRVPGSALAAMYDLLADLLESGVAPLKALDVLTEQTAHPVLQAALMDIRKQVAEGHALSDAMRSHPDIFRELSISVVQAGEEGGFLEDALKRIARLTDRQEELKSRVLGALAYPAFLLVAGFAVLAGMLAFFVPKFEPLFDRMQARGELPLPTVVLLDVSHTIRSHGGWIVLALGIVVFAARHWLASETTLQRFDRLRLKITGLGPIVTSLAISRFCRVLGTLLANGVPILKSMDIARKATGNRAMSAAIAHAAHSVSSGNSLAAPLAASGYFPRDVLEMITVGEQANRLETILLNVADKLDLRTQRKLEVLVRLLEPALMVLMAALIGLLVIALLMPIFESNGIARCHRIEGALLVCAQRTLAYAATSQHTIPERLYIDGSPARVGDFGSDHDHGRSQDSGTSAARECGRDPYQYGWPDAGVEAVFT